MATAGWIIPLLSAGSLTVLIRLLKLPRAPDEHVRAIFGQNPLTIPKNVQNSSSSTAATPAATVTVVGHRGGALDAPENTLAAFRFCKDRGCDFVEFDVSQTKDNLPVILHDDDLLRVAGINKKIGQLTWEECSKLDLSKGHPNGHKFGPQRIPSLEETIKLMLELNMKFFIDIKDANSTVVNAVCDAFARHPELYKLAVVSSFRVKAIYDIRRRDPNIVGSLAWRPHAAQYKTWTVDGSVIEDRFQSRILNKIAGWFDYCDEHLLHWAQWWFLGLSVVLLHKDAASRRDLQLWAKRGLHVFLWTVNDSAEKEHIRKNMNCNYMTDTLDEQTFRKPRDGHVNNNKMSAMT